jgi:hypothetical protein
MEVDVRVTVDFLLGSPKVQKEVGALAGLCCVGVVVISEDSKGSYLKDCTLVVGIAADSVAACASAISEKGSVVMPWTGASERAGTLATGL